MKRVFGVLVIIILVVSFFGVGYILIKKSMKPTVTFESEFPFYTNIIRKTVATGSITPRKEIEVKSQVSGVVEKLFVQAGDIVKNNDVIAKIKIIPNVVMLNNAEMRLKTALINFKNAQIEMNRQNKLFEEQVISEQEHNQYELEYNLRQQEVEAAENNLELVKEGASKNTGTGFHLGRGTWNLGRFLDCNKLGSDPTVVGGSLELQSGPTLRRRYLQPPITNLQNQLKWTLLTDRHYQST